MSRSGEAGKHQLPPPIFGQGARADDSRDGVLAGARLMPFTTLFYGALLGGTLTVTLLSWLDARSLGRLGRDFWRHLLTAALSVAVLGGSYYFATVDPMPPWMAQFFGKVDFRFIVWLAATRGYALVLCFAQWLRYWRYYKIVDSRALGRDELRYRVLPALFLGSMLELFMLHDVMG